MKLQKSLAVLLTLVLTFALLCGCSASAQTEEPTAAPAEATEAPVEATPSEAPEAAAEPVELFVSAAASLTDVLAEIAESYKAVAPNVTLTFTFDSSGTLQTQIEEGAPADVFVSAAKKQMNALNEKGLVVSDSIKDLLVNKVVLIVPAASTLDITSFEDVATDKVSLVAIGESSVPVGQYTEEIYTNLGTWDAVKAKANFGTNVRAVLGWVESGDVDCGIVYATDAAASGDKVRVICSAPEGSHKPVIYPAAVLANTAHPAEAQAFVDYLSSADAVAAFEAAGFAMN